jgi:hypothetical protein
MGESSASVEPAAEAAAGPDAEAAEVEAAKGEDAAAGPDAAAEAASAVISEVGTSVPEVETE